MDGDLVAAVAVGILIGLLFALLVGIFIIDPTIEENWHTQAVAEGHAEFYLDDDHVRQWRWLPPCAPERSEP